MTDKNLARIAALLRKAESTDNEHEADAFLQAAQRLATLASVDLALARAHTAGAERRSSPVQRDILIGPSGKRGLRTYVQLFLAIARANSVTCDVARDSSRVFAYGFDTDIDACEALFASLVVQMVRACDAYLHSGAHRQEQAVHVSLSPSGRPRAVRTGRAVHTTTARINFQLAFAARIGSRLAEASTKAQAEAIRRPGPAGSTGGNGVALVLRAREVELTEHYRRTSTARGSWGGFRQTGGYSEASRRAGDHAGRRARLGAATELGGSRRALDGGTG